MKSHPLTAYSRTRQGRQGAKKVRNSGRVPAVIYGGKHQSQSLEIDSKDLRNLMQHSVSENLLVDLNVSEDPRAKRLALLQEVQHHPLSGSVLHVDLHEVAEDQKVTVTVPVETAGEAVGVKTGGGMLEHVLFKFKVRALPKDLPEFIEVDVSNLELDQTIHIGDIKAPEGVEILGDPAVSVISVAAPRTETAEEGAETLPGIAAASAEPEMIKEKRRRSRRRPRKEEEVTARSVPGWTVEADAGSLFDRRTRESRPAIRADAAQCRFPRGRRIGAVLGSGLDDRAAVRSAGGVGQT